MNKTDNYRDRLFSTYAETHVKYLDSDIQEKIDWFSRYTQTNYRHLLIERDPKTARILDIGCNKGYLLSVLSEMGYEKLNGIDLSPQDLEEAKRLVPGAQLECIDAHHYLERFPAYFDVIFIKAVLEHVEKKDVIPLLERIHASLSNHGIVIIDVPNMDWLFASHERYLDFTHEVGFTITSLRQVMNSAFSHVQIAAVDHIEDTSKSNRLKKVFARYLITKLLTWADAQGAQNAIWARSIIGVGTKEI